MLWFSFGFLVLLFTYLGNPNGIFKDRKGYIVISQILLVLVLSYMTGMGGLLSSDHQTYVQMFRDAQDITFEKFFSTIQFRDFSFKLEIYRYEIGYIFFCIFCNKIGLGVAGYFLLAAIITNVFVVKTVYRFRYPVFCILIFIASRAYLQEVNIIRQTLAISIFAYSLKYIEEKNFKKFLLYVIFASLFHSSLLITLFLYLVRYVCKPSRQRGFIYVLIGFWIISIFIANSSQFLNFNFLNATTYVTLMEQSETEHFNELSLDYRYNSFILLLFVFYFKQKSSVSNIEYKFDISNIYMVCCILGCIFCNLSVNIFYFYRISLIFDIIYCFYLPSALQCMRPNLSISKYSLLFILILLFKVISYSNFCMTGDNIVGKTFYSINQIFE